MAVKTVPKAFAATLCLSCGSSFDRPIQRGRPQTRCNSCREGKTVGSDPSTLVLTNMTIDGITYIQNAEPCRDCGEVFMRARKKGRPPTRCEACQESFVSDQFETTTQDIIDSLYSGPADKLKGNERDLPKGNEAQCVLCWRIFTSDSAAEAHKSYAGRTSCVDPATLGMEPRERRGLPVWTRPSV